MKINRFTYPVGFQIMRWIAIFMAFILTLLIFLLLSRLLFPQFQILSGTTACDVSSSECSENFIGIILGILICLSTANFYPDIEVKNDGLTVGFLFLKSHIFWDQIIGVQPLPFVVMKKWYVKTKKLTPFFILYGIMCLEFSPCFFISSSMDGYKELFNEIRRHQV